MKTIFTALAFSLLATSAFAQSRDPMTGQANIEAYDSNISSYGGGAEEGKGWSRGGSSGGGGGSGEAQQHHYPINNACEMLPGLQNVRCFVTIGGREVAVILDRK
jgi:hypothetical protein